MDTDKKLSDWCPAEKMANKSQGVSLDLTFRNLSYTVGKGKNAKTILHQMSGAFKCGQLTAILGPSGAGKTSLMNILGGLKKSGVKGRVEVNGSARKFKSFRKHSAYITQKDHLLPYLTVDEYMVAAAHLKLGNDVSDKEKKSKIEALLNTLGLTDSRQTQISCLSGGECKRLAIGLELVDNPSILFLDEPTSGLDSSSSLQCVALLREIARSGRTVIATIHQPSSRLLDHFDHLYIVASGYCMYQGPIGFLVPYFQSMNLNCPSYHNPADFAMDVACGEHGNVLGALVSGVENGRFIYQESSPPTVATPSLSHDTGFYDEDEDSEMLDGRSKNKEKTREHVLYAAPFHSQVSVLLGRTWRHIYREKMLTLVRFTSHLLMGIIVGLVYWFCGNDADVVIHNIGLLFFSQLFILFASATPTVVTFPLERKVLAREHLNHWYNLKAYYMAKTLADIPFQFLFPGVYITIVYVMTNQPMSIERYFMLLTISILVSLVGQGIGIVFGAAFNLKVAVFLSLTAAVPFAMLSGFNARYYSLPSYLTLASYFSFMRHAFEGSMLSIYGYDRPFLHCAVPFCNFRNPIRILETFDMAQSSYYWSIVGLGCTFIVARIVGYFILRFKLNRMR